MHFIEEQNRAAVAHVAVLLRLGDSGADVLDARHHGGQSNKVRIGRCRNHPSKRRFARTGWSPEDHRMRATLFDSAYQRFTRFEQVPLPGKLGQRRRPHAVRQRPIVGDHSVSSK